MEIQIFKKSLRSIFIYLILIIFLTFIFFYLFNYNLSYATSKKTNSLELSIEIFFRNTQNFLQYILLAPIMPFFYMIDCIYTSWSISLSLKAHGLFNTLSNLFPHGFIEIPNFCLYTYISFNLCKKFYSKKTDIKEYLSDLLSFKYILIFSQVLIIFAALLEGLLT